MKPAPQKYLNATDRILLLYILYESGCIKHSGWGGGLFCDFITQREFLSQLLGINPSSIRNPIKSKKGKTMLFKIMDEKSELGQKEILDYSQRLKSLKKLFKNNFYPECIELIDSRLQELYHITPIN
jgi:hypothetical protein